MFKIQQCALRFIVTPTSYCTLPILDTKKYVLPKFTALCLVLRHDFNKIVKFALGPLKETLLRSLRVCFSKSHFTHLTTCKWKPLSIDTSLSKVSQWSKSSKLSKSP